MRTVVIHDSLRARIETEVPDPFPCALGEESLAEPIFNIAARAYVAQYDSAVRQWPELATWGPKLFPRLWVAGFAWCAN